MRKVVIVIAMIGVVGLAALERKRRTEASAKAPPTAAAPATAATDPVNQGPSIVVKGEELRSKVSSGAKIPVKDFALPPPPGLEPPKIQPTKLREVAARDAVYRPIAADEAARLRAVSEAVAKQRCAAGFCEACQGKTPCTPKTKGGFTASHHVQIKPGEALKYVPRNAKSR